MRFVCFQPDNDKSTPASHYLDSQTKSSTLSQSSSPVTRKVTNASWLPRDFIFHEDSEGQQFDCAWCLTDAVYFEGMKLRKMTEGRCKWQEEAQQASHFGAIWTRDFGAEVSLWVIDLTRHCFYRQKSRSWHAFNQRISHCKSCPQLWGRLVAEQLREPISSSNRPISSATCWSCLHSWEVVIAAVESMNVLPVSVRLEKQQYKPSSACWFNCLHRPYPHHHPANTDALQNVTEICNSVIQIKGQRVCPSERSHSSERNYIRHRFNIHICREGSVSTSRRKCYDIDYVVWKRKIGSAATGELWTIPSMRNPKHFNRIIWVHLLLRIWLREMKATDCQRCWACALLLVGKAVLALLWSWEVLLTATCCCWWRQTISLSRGSLPLSCTYRIW